MKHIGEKRLTVARSKIVGFGYRPIKASEVVDGEPKVPPPWVLVWHDHDHGALFHVAWTGQAKADGTRHHVTPSEQHPDVGTGSNGFCVDVDDLYIGPLPRQQERPSDGSPVCTTCKSRSLLDHEGWCEEGHVALQYALVEARKREARLKAFVLWLADLHAATAEYDGALKNTSASRRSRFASICRDAASTIEQLFTGNDQRERYQHEDKAVVATADRVGDRLRQAMDRLKAP